MISLKTKEEIEKMRYSGKVNYEVRALLGKEIKEGVTTEYLDKLAREYIESKDCTASFLGYEGYPASICASINEEIVHGIPSKRKLHNGDIITVDVGVNYKGLHTDAASTFVVGSVNKEVECLVNNTKLSLYEGIKVIKEGVKLNEVCKAVESVARKNGYGVIRELTGHGVGKHLHEDPYIPNYSNSESERIILKSGMTLAIEPMFSLEGESVWMDSNGWTISTQDGSPAAHFEHTILVTEKGYEILTEER
jgi:methionyl aminopeptidase